LFQEKNKLEGLIKPEIINAGKLIFGIMVDGHDTKVELSPELQNNIIAGMEFEEVQSQRKGRSK